ncbi:hypothetical protein Moror_10006 [Moniliophthora roreri MCA 2997]|uniref:Uncharacterized protein n=1 Tax=Moniliophthora roreri (strain MCA 2997) TaxID=1381753 RepID=V2WVI2_MONRO|nr:hypothetical protein Moror_10006 [Moniliophthora roreri MCA 2997]
MPLVYLACIITLFLPFSWPGRVQATPVIKRESTDENLSTIIIGVVLGAFIFLIASIGIVWYYLAKWRLRPAAGQSYPFTITGNTAFSSTDAELRPMRVTKAESTSAPTTPEEHTVSVWETRNPYVTPSRKKGSKVGTSVSDPSTTGSKRSKRSTPRMRSASVTEQTVSSIAFAPLTERQMEIDERIKEMNGKLCLFLKDVPKSGPGASNLVGKMTHDHRVLQWKNRIAQLEELKESDWALGKTDVVPKGLYMGSFSEAQDDMRSIVRPFR